MERAAQGQRHSGALTFFSVTGPEAMNPNPCNAQSLSPTTPRPPSPGVRPRAPRPDLPRWLWHDRLLRSVLVCCGLLLGAQLVLTLVHTAWIGPVTDWLLTVLAWPEAAVVVFVAVRLNRAR